MGFPLPLYVYTFTLHLTSLWWNVPLVPGDNRLICILYILFILISIALLVKFSLCFVITTFKKYLQSYLFDKWENLSANSSWKESNYECIFFWARAQLCDKVSKKGYNISTWNMVIAQQCCRFNTAITFTTVSTGSGHLEFFYCSLLFAHPLLAF